MVKVPTIMENRFEPSLNGFGDMEEEEINPETKSELYASSTAPEILFEEAVRKLFKYERSLETLVQRFSVNGVETGSEVHKVQLSKESHNSTDMLPQSTNLSDHSVYRSSDEGQRYVMLQIPYQTAEIVLRILDEDRDKIQRSVLKRAESCLHSVKENLATLKQMLQIQCENSDQPKKIPLKKTIEIADDMFRMVDKFDEKLLDCQVQNLSELLAISVKDEVRLSRLAERNERLVCPEPLDSNGRSSSFKTLVSNGHSMSSTKFYSIIFCVVACCIMVRLLMLYLEVHGDVLERICLFVDSFLGGNETATVPSGELL